MSPALAGRFSTTAPPGKPPWLLYFYVLLSIRYTLEVTMHSHRNGELCSSSLVAIYINYLEFYIGALFSPIYSIICISMIGSCGPLTYPHQGGIFLFEHFLNSGTIRCSRLLLFISCPSPTISNFSKKPWFLLWEYGFRNQDLGTACTYCY